MKFQVKLISIMLSVILVISSFSMVCAAEVPGDSLTARYTKSPVLINGAIINFEAYNINNNNYFKLRDIAQAISGTEKQFEVNWDKASGAVSLISGKSYTTIGGELSGGDGTDKYATNGTSNIVKDGAAISLSAYLINNNNYFKLRDLGQLFDFEVAWDSANGIIIVDTSKPYTGMNASYSEYIAFYELYNDVPDAGALLNLTCQNNFLQDKGSDKEQHVYYYSPINIKNPWGAMANYLDILMDNGFYIDSSSRTLNSIDCISKSGRCIRLAWIQNEQDESYCDAILLSVYTQLLSAEELAKLNFPD